jgi:hypothetical protein
MVYTFILLLRKDCHFVDGWYRQRRQCAAWSGNEPCKK